MLEGIETDCISYECIWEGKKQEVQWKVVHINLPCTVEGAEYGILVAGVFAMFCAQTRAG